ncbi:hypothetical protein HRbin27_01955 [bacterium HR27]|nr:hypothetical protein HRbin27_01955 [bacterium HR27]
MGYVHCPSYDWDRYVESVERAWYTRGWCRVPRRRVPTPHHQRPARLLPKRLPLSPVIGDPFNEDVVWGVAP